MNLLKSILDWPTFWSSLNDAGIDAVFYFFFASIATFLFLIRMGITLFFGGDADAGMELDVDIADVDVGANIGAKLQTDQASADLKVAEAKAEVEEVKKIVESKDAEINKISDAAKRKEVMHELTGPLSKDQREIMVDLLENVQTDGLRKAFDKYIPAVIDGKTPAKKKATLTESEAKEITGNKESNVSRVSQEENNNIIHIQKLAGLK